MKLAFSTLGCPDWSLEDILSTAKDLGYDGVEIRGIGRELSAPAAKPFAPENLDATVARFKQLGLEISCLTSGVRLNECYRIESHMADGRAYIDLAQKLAVPYVRVIGDSGPTPTDVPFDKVALRLRELAGYAKPKNVTVLIETNGAFSKSETMLRLLEKTAAENVAVLWDIHHPVRNYGETAAETYAALKNHIKYLHIKDSVCNEDGAQYEMIGYGDLPIKEVVDLLRADGFSGWLSLEWVKRWCLSLAEPGIVFPHYITHMRKLLG